MQKLKNLLGAARITGEIQQGIPHTEPEGDLIDPTTTDTPVLFVNIFNDCKKDQAHLDDSDALVTLYEIAVGKSLVTQAYHHEAAKMRKTLSELQDALKPFPKTNIEVLARTQTVITLLSKCEKLSSVIADTLKGVKAELDQRAGEFSHGTA